jgi:isopentenyl phosphate kinase
MGEDLVVLKLGGSLITDKSTPYKLNEEVIENIANEIKDCFDLGKIEHLVLVHGVGSYGHPPVIEYSLHKGFRDKGQLLSMSKTQQIVNKLRIIIASKFIQKGIPINLMHASSVVVGKKMVIKRNPFESLKGFLSLGMVPLIGGDMMYDESMGFSVCSGDQIAVILSRVLNAKRLIFATDVPGVFDKDPKFDKQAKLVKELNIDDIEQFLSKSTDVTNTDASGKMRGKLLTLLSIKNQIEKGLEIAILSMTKQGILKNYLKGEEIDLTKIVYKS